MRQRYCGWLIRCKFGFGRRRVGRGGPRIGADVPFFIYNNVGIGRGLGHEIEICDIQPDAWIVTVFPNDSSLH